MLDERLILVDGFILFSADIIFVAFVIFNIENTLYNI
jgi:hypothetical protein